MFVDCQNYDGSCGFNFMGNWFVVFQCKAIHYFVKRSWGRIFVGKVYSRNPRTLNPTNNDDSTVHQNVELYRKNGGGGAFHLLFEKRVFDKKCLCRIEHAQTKEFSIYALQLRWFVCMAHNAFCHFDLEQTPLRSTMNSSETTPLDIFANTSRPVDDRVGDEDLCLIFFS